MDWVADSGSTAAKSECLCVCLCVREQMGGEIKENFEIQVFGKSDEMNLNQLKPTDIKQNIPNNLRAMQTTKFSRH